MQSTTSSVEQSFATANKVYGATSQHLSKQSGSASNFMLIHPSFGCLMGWGEIPPGAPQRLPPINSREAETVTALMRRAVDFPGATTA